MVEYACVEYVYLNSVTFLWLFNPIEIGDWISFLLKAQS